ncbi:hypothetical protein LNP05_16835 [Klebsiella pneumoniae subsp. pneumoniae]|nr:hypothetical protein [Klebsiella pneumoniae subsp. pneumoniae]
MLSAPDWADYSHWALSPRRRGETRPVRLTNRLRNLAAGALASHLILSDNVTERASAARTLQREATPAMAALLQQRLQAETDDNVRGLLEVALARLQLTQPEASARLAAVTLLGHSADPETQALLIPFTDAQHEAGCGGARGGQR